MVPLRDAARPFVRPSVCPVCCFVCSLTVWYANVVDRAQGQRKVVKTEEARRSEAQRVDARRAEACVRFLWTGGGGS